MEMHYNRRLLSEFATLLLDQAGVLAAGVNYFEAFSAIFDIGSDLDRIKYLTKAT